MLGTPAEEDGGGKIDLINGGVFNDIDVAMMAHPGAENVSRPEILANIEYFHYFFCFKRQPN